jgi:phage replication-related protein YjqB (UPF0714/DUF867 family)
MHFIRKKQKDHFLAQICYPHSQKKKTQKDDQVNRNENLSSIQIMVCKYYFSLKRSHSYLKKMSDSMSGTENIQSESETSCVRNF